MSTTSQRVVLVAAVADNGVIGSDGGIPWRHPEDFAHFKAQTLGHTLVMGRATYDSIGRPLPGRATVVVTRDRGWQADGVLVAHSFDEALDLAAGLPGDVMVAGDPPRGHPLPDVGPRGVDRDPQAHRRRSGLGVVATQYVATVVLLLSAERVIVAA